MTPEDRAATLQALDDRVIVALGLRQAARMQYGFMSHEYLDAWAFLRSEESERAAFLDQIISEEAK